jgi:hypothetical protein
MSNLLILYISIIRGKQASEMMELRDVAWISLTHNILFFKHLFVILFFHAMPFWESIHKTQKF